MTHLGILAVLLALFFLIPFDLMADEFLFQSAGIKVWRAPSSEFRGAQDINVTALVREGKTLVIDPGVERWKDGLLAMFPVIDEIWITHAHPDHAALSGILQYELGASVLCSVQGKAILENPGAFLPGEFDVAGPFKGDIFPWYLRPFAKMALKFAYGPWPPAHVDETFNPEGTVRYGVTVRYLPGHTDGSVGFSLVEEGRHVLIIGDLFQQRSAGDFVLSINLPGADLDKALGSLQEMQSWEPDIIIPAHGKLMKGASFISDGIDRTISKYNRYREKVLAFLLKRGNLPSLASIANEVPFDWPESYRPGFTQKRSLVLAVLRSLHKERRLPTSIATRISVLPHDFSIH